MWGVAVGTLLWQFVQRSTNKQIINTNKSSIISDDGPFYLPDRDKLEPRDILLYIARTLINKNMHNIMLLVIVYKNMFASGRLL